MDPRGSRPLNLTIDASVFLAFYLDEGGSVCLQFSRTLADPAVQIQQPAIWPYELANGLRKAERRGRIEEALSRATLVEVSELPIELENGFPLVAAADLLEKARKFSLSAYDAAYLNFCKERGSALWTLDTKLRSAARADGVQLLRDS